MTDRCQLNLRLDGRRNLLDNIKEIAATEGLSLNAWVIKTLEQAANVIVTPQSEGQSPTSDITDIEPMLDTLLDKKLAVKLAAFEERLGKLSA